MASIKMYKEFFDAENFHRRGFLMNHVTTEVHGWVDSTNPQVGHITINGQNYDTIAQQVFNAHRNKWSGWTDLLGCDELLQKFLEFFINDPEVKLDNGNKKSFQSALKHFI